ncbi:MAG: BatD family protein [Candidatus Cloacimonetes bacterium]|nr:BatD family protein [Candidatus Cloacimonadota bacterium]
MKKTLALITLLLPLFLFGLSVTASVNKLTIELGDRLAYTLQVKDSKRINISEPAAPQIEGMTFLNMSGSSGSSTSFINGTFSSEQYRNFTYFYSPQGEGEINIPAQKITIANKVYTTQSFNIKVIKGDGSSSRRGSSTPFGNFGSDDDFLPWRSEKVQGRSMILATLEKSKVYKGEPLIVSYYLYTDQMVRTFSIDDEIDFAGYGKSIFEQPTSLEYETVQHKGKRMQRALLKKLTLLPRQEGSLKIPRLKGSARIYEFGYSNLEMVSEDRSFEVISLPSQGVPKSFTGAVGSFTVSSEVKEKEIALGEAITLTLRIAGRGNFNQFGNPELTSTNAQISSPVPVDNLEGGIKGSRRLFYTIVPAEKGNYQIPSLEFSWFDTDSGKYRTYNDESESVKVKSANVASYFSGLLEGDKPATIRPMINRDSYPSFRPLFHRIWYWLALCLILIASIFAWRVSRNLAQERRDPKSFRIKRAENRLKKELDTAQNLAKNLDMGFYSHAETVLTGYLFDKYDIPTGMSNDEKLESLHELAIDRDLIAEIGDFLGICSSRRFQPQGADFIEISSDFVFFRKLVREIIKNGGKKQ